MRTRVPRYGRLARWAGVGGGEVGARGAGNAGRVDAGGVGGRWIGWSARLRGIRPIKGHFTHDGWTPCHHDPYPRATRRRCRKWWAGCRSKCSSSASRCSTRPQRMWWSRQNCRLENVVIADSEGCAPWWFRSRHRRSRCRRHCRSSDARPHRRCSHRARSPASSSSLRKGVSKILFAWRFERVCSVQPKHLRKQVSNLYLLNASLE